MKRINEYFFDTEHFEVEMLWFYAPLVVMILCTLITIFA